VIKIVNIRGDDAPPCITPVKNVRTRVSGESHCYRKITVGVRRSTAAGDSEREQKDHTRKGGNPLIDGCGNRRRMRGRLDMVERDGVQREGAAIVCWKESTPSYSFTGP
jgi:hypothetical protein